MTQGMIQTLHRERGFGFIALAAGGQDLYFHGDELVGVRFDELQTGQHVRFTIQADPDNPYRLHAEGIEILVEAMAAD
jgi:cold shock CspA family protein